MGSLSKEEQAAEFAFMNPLANSLKTTMKAVIKQKVHSALCNADAVEAYNKAMYVHESLKYDEDKDEDVMVQNPDLAERTHHHDLQPAATRISSYKRRTFGKKYEDAVGLVKYKDQ